MSTPIKRPLSYLSLALVVFCLRGFVPHQVQDGQSAAEPAPWRILVTNDDGYATQALGDLVAALAEHYEVVVCAPDGNRSGSSQSILAFSSVLSVRDVEIEGASRAVAIGGTPADAVSYGLLELGKDKPFDLVVSGINEGPNVGDLAHMSGTVGAAMEAIYLGVPAIAVSRGGRSQSYAAAAQFTARFVAKLQERGSRPGIVYSINVPSGEPKDMLGVAPRPMGGSFIVNRGWVERETVEGEPGAAATVEFNRDAPEGSDTKAFFEGYITITPMHFDWTDKAALADLGTWDLKPE